MEIFRQGNRFGNSRKEELKLNMDPKKMELLELNFLGSAPSAFSLDMVLADDVVDPQIVLLLTIAPG